MLKRNKSANSFLPCPKRIRVEHKKSHRRRPVAPESDRGWYKVVERAVVDLKKVVESAGLDGRVYGEHGEETRSLERSASVSYPLCGSSTWRLLTVSSALLRHI